MNEHANVEHSEAAKFQCRHCGKRFGNTQAVREGLISRFQLVAYKVTIQVDSNLTLISKYQF